MPTKGDRLALLAAAKANREGDASFRAKFSEPSDAVLPGAVSPIPEPFVSVAPGAVAPVPVVEPSLPLDLAARLQTLERMEVRVQRLEREMEVIRARDRGRVGVPALPGGKGKRVHIGVRVIQDVKERMLPDLEAALGLSKGEVLELALAELHAKHVNKS